MNKLILSVACFVVECGPMESFEPGPVDAGTHTPDAGSTPPDAGDPECKPRPECRPYPFFWDCTKRDAVSQCTVTWFCDPACTTCDPNVWDCSRYGICPARPGVDVVILPVTVCGGIPSQH